MVIVLIIIGIILIVFNLQAVRKENKSFIKTYSSAKNSMTDYEIELGKLRKEFAETLVEIQIELEEIKRKVNYFEHRNFSIEKDTYKISEEFDENYIEEVKEQSPTKDVSVNSRSIKIEQVNKMLGEGLTVDQIAADLQLGKGEVLLIKELYLK